METVIIGMRITVIILTGGGMNAGAPGSPGGPTGPACPVLP